jgi:hypothetical protein
VLLVSPDASGDVAESMNPLTVVRGSHSSGAAQAALTYSPVLTEAGAGHEILDIDVARGGRLWSTLPPVPVDGSIAGAKKEASILVTGVTGSSAPGEVEGRGGSARPKSPGGARAEVPLVAVMRHGLGRVAVFAGHELWRWDLVPRGFGAEASAFSELVTSSVRWLVHGEEAKRLAISTAKTDYFWGEPVALAARVVDEDLKPRAGARVEAKIVDRSQGKVILMSGMIEKSAGNHVQLIDLLPPAAYTVMATATLDGTVYAEDAAGFTVSSRGLEDSDFDGDRALLGELARATGGKFYDARGAAGLADDLNPGSVIAKTSRDLRLRLSLASFLVLAGLLGVEWFIRRSKMLA